MRERAATWAPIATIIATNGAHVGSRVRTVATWAPIATIIATNGAHVGSRARTVTTWAPIATIIATNGAHVDGMVSWARPVAADDFFGGAYTDWVEPGHDEVARLIAASFNTLMGGWCFDRQVMTRATIGSEAISSSTVGGRDD